MIINVRGTNGSGKTTVVRRVLKQFPHEPLELRGRSKRPTRYRLQSGGQGTIILGSYENLVTGGCDTLKPIDEIERLLRRSQLEADHVIFEGVMVSRTFTRWASLANELGDFWWLFLNTPLETCIEGVISRRRSRGKIEEQLPPQTKERIVDGYQRNVRWRPRVQATSIFLSREEAVSWILRRIAA